MLQETDLTRASSEEQSDADNINDRYKEVSNNIIGFVYVATKLYAGPELIDVLSSLHGGRIVHKIHRKIHQNTSQRNKIGTFFWRKKICEEQNICGEIKFVKKIFSTKYFCKNIFAKIFLWKYFVKIFSQKYLCENIFVKISVKIFLWRYFCDSELGTSGEFRRHWKAVRPRCVAQISNIELALIAGC